MGETWGLTDIDLSGNVAMHFYKTAVSWRVSATAAGSTVRLPWFDFKHRDESLMTHVSVYDGFFNAEVVQDRPKCETVCHPSECASACSDAQCFSTTPSLECSAVDETGFRTDADRVCCEGLPRSIEIDPVPVDQWVSLGDNTDLITSACAAFPGSYANCADIAGRKGQVQSCDVAAKTCQVWVPATLASDSAEPGVVPPETYVTLPVFALTTSSAMQTKSIVIPSTQYRTLWRNDWGAETFRVDYHTGIIWSASSEKAVEYGLGRGWFISSIKFNPGYWYGSRWFQYSKNTVSQLRRTGKGDVSVYLTDEPLTPRPVCGLSYYPEDYSNANLAGKPWVDYKGNNCSVYERDDYCTRHAEPTVAWCENIFVNNTKTRCDGNTDMISDGCAWPCNDPDGNAIVSYAVFECCECGGGDTQEP